MQENMHNSPICVKEAKKYTHIFLCCVCIKFHFSNDIQKTNFNNLIWHIDKSKNLQIPIIHDTHQGVYIQNFNNKLCQ